MKRNWAYKLLVRTLLVFLVLSITLITLLRWVPVRYTPVMLKRAFQFREDKSYRAEQEWVSLDEISPELIKAVISSEDNKFHEHHGFDFTEIKDMLKQHLSDGSKLRGCSTISQQTAKNVFTFGTRSYARKIMETYWTALIELIWGKRRIMEVYLNVVEWGYGIYGAERASNEYYGMPANRLKTEQAAAMAVCLPKPLSATPDHLSPAEKHRCARIIEQYPFLKLSIH